MGLGDVVGTVGVSLVLVAFLANLSGRLASSGRAFPAFNAAGAGLACGAAALIEFWPFVVLNAGWAAAALVSLLNNTRGRAA